MDIFFNELSTKMAPSDVEAKEWLTKLANLGLFLQRIINSLQENGFKFRRNEDFAEMKITNTQSISEFLFDQKNFQSLDPISIFLIGIFDTPYITNDDPKHSVYDSSYIEFEGKSHDKTGIMAAYLKKSLVVSFDNDAIWDNCNLDILATWLDETSTETKEQIAVLHASQIKHVRDCHLEIFKSLFDYTNYRPQFDYTEKKQNLLYLVEIYSLILGDDVKQVWNDFYKNISTLSAEDRISKIKEMAKHIANVQGWQEANSSLKKKNTNRILYMIPNSDFIVSVDTLHGDFEILLNKKSPNHCGSVSFDGKRFEKGEKDHSINI